MAFKLCFFLSLFCLVLGCDSNNQNQTNGKDDHHGHSHASNPHHDEDKDDGHDSHKGEKIDRGQVKIAGYELKVIQVGKIEKEVIFELQVLGENPLPVAIRGWLGTSDAKGVRKAKAEENTKNRKYHFHLEVPEKGVALDTFWLEIQTEKKEREKKSISLK